MLAVESALPHINRSREERCRQEPFKTNHAPHNIDNGIDRSDLMKLNFFGVSIVNLRFGFGQPAKGFQRFSLNPGRKRARLNHVPDFAVARVRVMSRCDLFGAGAVIDIELDCPNSGLGTPAAR